MPMGSVMPGAAPAVEASEVSQARSQLERDVSLMPCSHLASHHMATFLLPLILALHQSTHPANLCALLALGSRQPPWDLLPARDAQAPAQWRPCF